MSEDLNNDTDIERNSDLKKVTSSVAKLLQELIEENERSPQEDRTENSLFLSQFDSVCAPIISINDYLSRIVFYSRVEEATIILALVYIDRFCEKMKIKLRFSNVHKLVFLGFILAIKFNEDDFFDNNFYSKVAGLTLKELNSLETVTIINTDFRLWVDYELYSKYKMYLNNYE
jgi:hypothetical protein